MKWPLFLFLILPMLSFGQNPPKPNIQPTYADAVYLAELENLVKTKKVSNLRSFSEEIKSVLARYNINEKNADHIQNPFLQDLLDAIKIQPSVEQKISELTTKANQDKDKGSNLSAKSKDVDVKAIGLNTAPGFGWEAAVINGLSTFMANRFKQEVIYYGLNKLFDQISAKEEQIFDALLPETYQETKRLYDLKSYYSADLIFLRQVVDNDLGNIHKRLASEAYRVFPRIPPQGADILKIAANLHADLGTGISLPGIFQKLNSEIYHDQEIAKAIAINHLLSEALRDTVGGKSTWININQLNISNPNYKTNRYFIGLLNEQFKPYSCKYDIYRFEKSIKQLLFYFEELNAASQFIAKNNYYLNTEQGLALLGMLQSSFSTFLKSGIAEDIFYLNKEYLTFFSNYQDFASSLVRRDYQKALVSILSQMKEYLPEDDENKYRRSLIFMVQLAETKDDKDMEQLLEAYALPIGGSSIKRNSNFNVSLNGYVGLTAGNEIAYGSENQAKTNIGLAAPIGVSINFNKNFTVFASIIDLGTLVNVRLNNDTTFFSNLKFEHFLAPGIGLYYNFKKSPITLGAHYNYIPNLRTIKIGNGEAAIAEKNISVSRFNVSLLVDIPFFTLYNK
ncbi:hypothetical protein [Sphingobacterium mizutaii]|uniref:hypothetical protein n=1 Tax=Sphingobacterium mizutaii TaxID=1010 RepID=UPI003D98F4AE